jgi:hypothetical protein
MERRRWTDSDSTDRRSHSGQHGLPRKHLAGIRATHVHRRVAALVLTALTIGTALFGRHGPSAIAAATLGATIVHNIAATLSIRDAGDIAIPNYLHTLLPPLALNCAMALVLWISREGLVIAHFDALTRMSALVVTGVIFYGGALWLFARDRLLSAYRWTRASI